MSPGETNVSRRDYVKQGAVQISYCLCDSSQTPASMGSPLSPLLEIRSELSNADNDENGFITHNSISSSVSCLDAIDFYN